jgi:hypothetical protein
LRFESGRETVEPTLAAIAHESLSRFEVLRLNQAYPNCPKLNVGEFVAILFVTNRSVINSNWKQE